MTEVIHKIYGEGVVTKTEKDMITVTFPTHEKKFPIPRAFTEGFLKTTDINLLKSIGVLENIIKEKAEDDDNKKIKNQSAPPYWLRRARIGNIRDGVLKSGFSYGTKAQEIYLGCSQVFGWDDGEKGKFGKQQRLYAQGASPEGYSPWFMSHHCWLESRRENNTIWWNRISLDTRYKDGIDEEWTNVQKGLRDDLSKRITFAKNKDGQYIFIGVYEPIEINEDLDEAGKKIWIKSYKLIQKDYPEINSDENDEQTRQRRFGQFYFLGED